MAGRPPTPAIDRILSRVITDSGGCWIFQGAKTHGYGTVTMGSILDGSARAYPAHRLAYMALVGEIPDGHDLHHLCKNRACVNPEHLEPIDHRQHTVEHNPGVGPCRVCGSEDWYIYPHGTRACRECKRRKARASWGAGVRYGSQR